MSATTSVTVPRHATGSPGGGRARRLLRGPQADPGWARPALCGLLALTALLYLWDLGRNGWANDFYAAAVQSLQSAYAAPLILLAQTRQAARDKANADADAEHREALAVANEERLASAAQSSKMMLDLLEQNTRLTELTKALTERVETLTSEMHDHFVKKPAV